MEGLATKLGTSVPELMNAIISAMVDEATKSITDSSAKEQAQTALTNKLNSCLKKKVTIDDQTQELVNFYLLIFVNKADGMIYNGGNTENKFANYTSNGTMINVTQILQNLATNVEYDGYKQYQYIQMDLYAGSALGNIGQVVLVNQAYDSNYTPKTNA